VRMIAACGHSGRIAGLPGNYLEPTTN